jgi:hypothetical protein
MSQLLARFNVGSPRLRRLIRSYGLLILIAIAFLLMAIFVSTVDRTVPADQGSAPAAGVS